ncbi:hypothetical protein AX16_008727 [Volvariella volvacea WC 439]|nr:hypothetical protein AX16_008727 [Volvariella volvacea WC 439]
MNDLPLEIWREIALYVHDDTSKPSGLRLVSRYFNALFTPFIVRSFSILITPNALKYTVNVEQEWSWHAYKPIPDAFTSYVTALTVLFDVQSQMSSESPDPKLWQDLAQLRGLKGLQVKGRHRADTEPVIHRVLDTIIDATQGELSSLSFLMEATLPDSVLGLHKLEALDYFHVCDPYPRSPCPASPFIASQLRSVFKNNQHLEDIQIDVCCDGIPTRIFFRDIFLSPMSNLQSLVIDGDVVTIIGPLALPELDQLQVLRVLGGSSLNSISSVDIHDFWAAWRSSKAKPKTLHTDYLSASLFDYISSFRGLKECIIPIRVPIHSPISMTSIQNAFSVHADTLERLCIKVWCTTGGAPDEEFTFSPHAEWLQPPALPNLLHLEITCSPQLPLTEENFGLVLNFLSGFPKLEYAEVDWLNTAVSQVSGIPKHYITETGAPKRLLISHDDADSEFSHASEEVRVLLFDY